MKIALAMIVKGDDSEASVLDRCLASVAPFVDGVFITSTFIKGEKPNKEVQRVAEFYGATVSTFEWVDDFAAARNYNFAQVPADFDYIIWTDADDEWTGLDRLKPTIEANPKDAYAFWYFYAFDEYGQPTVAHKKSMVIRNDGCAKWVGMIHEDLQPQRNIDVFLIEGISRCHYSSAERQNESIERNERIAKKELKKNGSKDPRYEWNYGNALLGGGKYKEAVTIFKKFLKSTESVDERFLIRIRIAECYKSINEFDKAEEQLLIACGEKPNQPDAFIQLGTLYSVMHQYDKASFYILFGIRMKPAYHSMIVFNPRDYDYNPMMVLANVFFNQGRPDLALPVLEGCLKINPGNKYVESLITEMNTSKGEIEKALVLVKEIEAEPDVAKKIEMINNVPEKLKPHPAICMLRNKYVVKTESTGKEIAYYCGETKHEWNPILFKTKGMGGSEEAVYNLSKMWAQQGYKVTVFNNCGPEIIEADGVTYKPWWMYNPKDKYDTLILWRHPSLLDHGLNATKIIVDMHDVVSKAEFTPKRIAKIDKVMVKSEAHRRLFPNISDDKIFVVPNGMDVDMFTETVEKDQYLMINTSSPDRSMDVLPALFKRVKEQVPQARLQWAYGFDIFDNSHGGNKAMMAFKDEVVTAMADAGVEVMGRLPQHEVAKMYQRANVLAYPTEFFEIDCISVRKAQLAGCYPVSTDFGALATTNTHGYKVKSRKTDENWSLPYQLSFGLTDKKGQDEWVKACVEKLQTPIEDRSAMIEWAKQFNWTNISNIWLEQINGTRI